MKNAIFQLKSLKNVAPIEEFYLKSLKNDAPLEETAHAAVKALFRTYLPQPLLWSWLRKLAASLNPNLNNEFRKKS